MFVCLSEPPLTRKGESRAGRRPDPQEKLLRDGGGSEIILLQINKWIFILEDGSVPFGGCEVRSF